MWQPEDRTGDTEMHDTQHDFVSCKDILKIIVSLVGHISLA